MVDILTKYNNKITPPGCIDFQYVVNLCYKILITDVLKTSVIPLRKASRISLSKVESQRQTPLSHACFLLISKGNANFKIIVS